jgi:hypothetical protein
VPKSGAIVRVTTPCDTVYRRTTTSTGELEDPGFPYAELLKICVSDGIRQRTLTSPNDNFNVTIVPPVNLVAGDQSGTCA